MRSSGILPRSTVQKASWSTTTDARLRECILIPSAHPRGAAWRLPVAGKELGAPERQRSKPAFIPMLSASLQLALTSEQQQNQPPESSGHRRVTARRRRPQPSEVPRLGFGLRSADGGVEGAGNAERHARAPVLRERSATNAHSGHPVCTVTVGTCDLIETLWGHHFG